MKPLPHSKIIGRFWLVPVLLIQTACVGISTSIQRYPARPVPASRAPVPATEPETRFPPPPAAREPAALPSSEGRAAGSGVPISAPPAVLALTNEAQAALETGDLDNAAASLERAIRIQPRNPMLWHDLAEIRLKQQQPGRIEDAENLAKRSNSHAKGNSALIRANWAIIAESRRLRGDAEGAADAQRKSGEGW
jgi:tetratricopeptide (TPR) repeat protein